MSHEMSNPPRHIIWSDDPAIAGTLALIEELSGGGFRLRNDLRPDANADIGEGHVEG